MNSQNSTNTIRFPIQEMTKLYYKKIKTQHITMRNFSYVTEHNICSVKYLHASQVKNSLQMYKRKKKQKKEKIN